MRRFVHSLALALGPLALGFVAGPLVAVAAADASHPMTADDLIAFDRVGGPVVSPDGRSAVYPVSSLDLEANKRRSHLWLTSTSVTPVGTPRRLTSNDASDSDPAFAPDGRSIWFVSARGGSSQLWRIAVDGGEAEQMTRLPLDVGNFRLSPDGTHVALALEVYPDCDGPACTKKRISDGNAKRATGQIYDQLFIRHWDEWGTGRRSHVFILPIAGTGGPAIAEAPVDIMKGMDADCPSTPFGGSDEYAFTPDGKSIVLSSRNVGREEAWSTNFDLYLAPIDGSAAPKNLTAANKAWDTSPVFSPDGKTLAYLATKRPGYESDRRHIVLRDVSRGMEGAERFVGGEWDKLDLSAGEIVWSRDGRTLYTTADRNGHQAILAIDAGSGAARVIVAEGNATAPRIAGDRLLYSLDHLRSPAELYSVRLDGKDARALTRTNEARLAAVRLGEPEAFTFAGWNNETVHAWIVKPVDFDAGKKYPIAFLVHGGPQGSFGNHFHYRWNPQFYAAAGYAAIMVDFHGSTGYGQAFTDSIGGDWGGKPLEDLQKGLEAAIKKYPFLDGSRASALGASYGGYMINWIAGNWADRFKCLVSHDGNLDERMAYFDTEELWFPEWDHRGNPWDNPENYNKHNPIDFVKNWKAPMLVIHGGRDYRVVDTQGMSTFTALQRRGIPSRFLYFPDENHWVIKPQNSLLWHKTVLEWLNRWNPANR